MIACFDDAGLDAAARFANAPVAHRRRRISLASLLALVSPSHAVALGAVLENSLFRYARTPLARVARPRAVLALIIRLERARQGRDRDPARALKTMAEAILLGCAVMLFGASLGEDSAAGDRGVGAAVVLAKAAAMGGLPARRLFAAAREGIREFSRVLAEGLTHRRKSASSDIRCGFFLAVDEPAWARILKARWFRAASSPLTGRIIADPARCCV